mmetsp:Transcript_13216/g.19878  ORF Transcript_13216/g.19878 Transcript_13216/m.19878 type:complete len:97 (-) Transcript_13216:201-491(-)
MSISLDDSWPFEFGPSAAVEKFAESRALEKAGTIVVISANDPRDFEYSSLTSITSSDTALARVELGFPSIIFMLLENAGRQKPDAVRLTWSIFPPT